MVSFSIIIPTFNSEATISRVLKSILSQSYTLFEIFIVDGCSKDETLAIIRKYCLQDARVKFISEKDKGTYDAMNKGIDKATGEWIYFLGSDDQLYDNNVLQKIAEASTQANAKVIYGNVRVINDASWAKDGDIYDGRFDFKKLVQRNICHQAIFYNRSFLNQFGLRYNLSYRLLADWDFNLQCFAKTLFHYTDLIIANFYSGGQTTTQNEDVKFSADFLKNVFTYFNITPFDKRIDQLPDYFIPVIYAMQKKQSAIRYYYHRIKRTIIM